MLAVKKFNPRPLVYPLLPIFASALTLMEGHAIFPSLSIAQDDVADSPCTVMAGHRI